MTHGVKVMFFLRIFSTDNKIHNMGVTDYINSSPKNVFNNE